MLRKSWKHHLVTLWWLWQLCCSKSPSVHQSHPSLKFPEHHQPQHSVSTSTLPHLHYSNVMRNWVILANIHTWVLEELPGRPVQSRFSGELKSLCLMKKLSFKQFKDHIISQTLTSQYRSRSKVSASLPWRMPAWMYFSNSSLTITRSFALSSSSFLSYDKIGLIDGARVKDCESDSPLESDPVLHAAYSAVACLSAHNF